MNRKSINISSKKYKYECIRCKYNTNNLNHYNRHLHASSHLLKCNICSKCMKVFKDSYHLLRHANMKKSCVVLETVTPITININDNSINDNSINDNSINDNSINLNNENYINFDPTDFTGNKFKIFRQLKNNSNSSFFDKSNIATLTNNILELLNKSNFDELKENKITEDILKSNDSSIIKSKIKKIRNLCNNNELLKEFAPRISENRLHNDIDNKLRLYPHLITEPEFEENKEFIDDYKEHNTDLVNNYLNNILKNALISNNMDLNNDNKFGIVKYKNKICVKHTKKQLEEFNLDKIIKITKFKELVTNVIDDLISKHIIDLDQINLNELKIAEELSKHFLELVKNFNK